MSGSAITSPLRASRWILIAAAVLLLFGSIGTPAKAGDFEGPYYGPARYQYQQPYGYRQGCSSCGGCYSYRCGCGGCRPTVRHSGGYVRRYVERRYIERDYVERSYSSPVRRYPRYSYGCCGPSRSYYQGGYRSNPFPYGYGGIRSERPYGYGPSAYYDAPRPPAPVGYDPGSYGDEGGRWDAE